MWCDPTAIYLATQIANVMGKTEGEDGGRGGHRGNISNLKVTDIKTENKQFEKFPGVRSVCLFVYNSVIFTAAGRTFWRDNSWREGGDSCLQPGGWQDCLRPEGQEGGPEEHPGKKTAPPPGLCLNVCFISVHQGDEWPWRTRLHHDNWWEWYCLYPEIQENLADWFLPVCLVISR